MIYSCANCRARHVGCHITCEDFIQESQQAADLKEKIRMEKQLNDGLLKNRVMAYHRFMKKHRQYPTWW